MDRGAWQTVVHRVTESDTTEVTEHACTHPSSQHYEMHVLLPPPSFINRQVGWSSEKLSNFPKVTELGCADPRFKSALPWSHAKSLHFPHFKLFSTTNRLLKCPHRKHVFPEMNLKMDTQEWSQGSWGNGIFCLSKRMIL